MTHKKEITSNMVEGNILKTIIVFALPLLGSSLIQQLYNTADMIFTGNFIGKTAAAAVGSGSLLFACLIGLLTGLAVGVGVVVAQKIGAGNYTAAEKAVHCSLAFGSIIGILLTIGGLFFTRNLLELINTPTDVMPEAIIYLKIYFLSMFPMVIYNIGIGILRATGDSKRPFYVLALGGILNILANTVFIIFLDTGVAGIAIATLLSQCVTAAIIMYILYNANNAVRFSFKKLNLETGTLKEILYIGLPTGLQSVVITLSNLIVQYYINGYGTDAAAAYAAYFKLENLIWMPMVALGQAMTTFSGQNTGACNFKRIKKGTYIIGLLSIIIAASFAAIILLMPEFFFKIFINDNSVIQSGKSIIFITFPFYWLYGLMETYGGAVRGMGYALQVMFITGICLCLMRIIMLPLLTAFYNEFTTVAVVYPLSWLLTALVFILSFLYIYRLKTAKTASSPV